jgi:hypothetical protein
VLLPIDCELLQYAYRFGDFFDQAAFHRFSSLNNCQQVVLCGLKLAGQAPCRVVFADTPREHFADGVVVPPLVWQRRIMTV